MERTRKLMDRRPDRQTDGGQDIIQPVFNGHIKTLLKCAYLSEHLK